VIPAHAGSPPGAGSHTASTSADNVVEVRCSTCLRDCAGSASTLFRPGVSSRTAVAFGSIASSSEEIKINSSSEEIKDQTE
jgi:hypothetical protein